MNKEQYKKVFVCMTEISAEEMAKRYEKIFKELKEDAYVSDEKLNRRVR